MKESHVPYRPGMTLMPGQSTSIGVEIPMGIGQGGTFSFQEVPPPATAPVQPRAKELGLPDGLRVEPSSRGSWRCGHCGRMQHDGTEQVWVPDGARMGDPIWSVTESARRVAFNGGSTAWCLSCAKRLGGGLASRVADQFPWMPVIAAIATMILLMVALANSHS